MPEVAASARDVAREAAVRLKDAGVPEPTASAEILLVELLGVGRGDLAFVQDPLTGEQTRCYERWIQHRLHREPVQRILGYAYFRNLKLRLNEYALIPRFDTESVVEAALERIDRRSGRCRVLDIGTGSGAIAISIAQERPGCEVHATEVSEAALEVARQNARMAGVSMRFHRADVASGLGLSGESIDLLVSNPPYVKSDNVRHLPPEVRDWDPPFALDGGSDGLVFYRRIFAETPMFLESGADMVLEVGDGQSGDVLELGRRAGFTALGTRPDLAGTVRAVLLRWEP